MVENVICVLAPDLIGYKVPSEIPDFLDNQYQVLLMLFSFSSIFLLIFKAIFRPCFIVYKQYNVITSVQDDIDVCKFESIRLSQKIQKENYNVVRDYSRKSRQRIQ